MTMDNDYKWFLVFVLILAIFVFSLFYWLITEANKTEKLKKEACEQLIVEPLSDTGKIAALYICK